jgi:hypothetical protein
LQEEVGNEGRGCKGSAEECDSGEQQDHPDSACCLPFLLLLQEEAGKGKAEEQETLQKECGGGEQQSF